MSHRLWFRLDDVLPLAEHAMACFAHRTASVQTAAHIPSGPALIWTSTAVLDVLTSNGVPAWYGERGTTHAAEAHTWRDASGRYGTAWRDHYHTAYLPLTAPNANANANAAIDQLRLARDSEHRWVAVDIDPADRHVIGAGRIHVLAGRDDLVPAGTAWTRATVTCHDVGDQPYPALIADGYTSDSGHLLARFDRPTIERLAADLDAVHANSSSDSTGGHPILRVHGETLTVLEQHDNGHAGTHRPTGHLTPDGDGYYTLGAYLWPWRHARHPSQPGTADARTGR